MLAVKGSSSSRSVASGIAKRVTMLAAQLFAVTSSMLNSFSIVADGDVDYGS